ncbi:unnamed protein product [Caenorhabditis brenneri]
MEEKPLPLTEKLLWFCLTCICLIVYFALMKFLCFDPEKSNQTPRNNNSGNRHSDDGHYYIGSTGYEMGPVHSGGGDHCGGDPGGGGDCGGDFGGDCGADF